MPLEPRIDALFTLPLDAFVSARNELAKALARAGDKTMAAEVKALAKPSVASWTLNQVVRADRELASSFLDACDELASAQLAPKSPGRGDERYSEAQSAQRMRLQVLLDRAAERLEASPQKRVLTDRIARTLRAVARDPTVRGAFLEGRLTSDLEEPGFDVFAARVGIEPGLESGAGARLRLVPSPEPSAPPAESAPEIPPRAPPAIDAAARRARLAALEAEAAKRRAAVLAAHSASRAARADVEAARSASAAAAFAQSEAAAARDRALEAVEAERRRLADAEARAEEAARAYALAATRAALEAGRAAERERALAEAERAEQEARSAEREAEARVASEAAFD